MAGQPGAGRGPGRPEIIQLGSVPGFVVLDLPDAAVCAGGTRLAPDVTIAEVALLARAMTYKFAALGDRVGGAKAGVPPSGHTGADTFSSASRSRHRTTAAGAAPSRPSQPTMRPCSPSGSWPPGRIPAGGRRRNHRLRRRSRPGTPYCQRSARFSLTSVPPITF
jgi:Glu/Leu/Phe/Val dehydrogenase, dimerisation domain